MCLTTSRSLVVNVVLTCGVLRFPTSELVGVSVDASRVSSQARRCWSGISRWSVRTVSRSSPSVKENSGRVPTEVSSCDNCAREAKGKRFCSPECRRQFWTVERERTGLKAQLRPQGKRTLVSRYSEKHSTKPDCIVAGCPESATKVKAHSGGVDWFCPNHDEKDVLPARVPVLPDPVPVRTPRSGRPGGGPRPRSSQRGSR